MPETYEILNPSTVVDYVANNPRLAAVLPPSRIREVREVGDGNLNLVFILAGTDGPGMVLKQALPYVRLVGPDWPMTPDRAAKEAAALRSHGALCPSLVPSLFDYDTGRYILAMEDLSDHAVWRHALNRGERHEGAATDVGSYIAHVAFGTSVFGMTADAQKAALAASVNPQLCEITEDLVLTEPTRPAQRNSVIAANERDARELIEDDATVREMGWLKWQFMTQAEALIHGDLHTGSVLVRAGGGAVDGTVGSTRAFDTEFSFHGPVAFDLGTLWANHVLAASRAIAQGEDERAAWILDLVPRTWNAFEQRLRDRWPERVDPRALTGGVLDGLLSRWRSEAWLFGAAEAARRIVGMAKVSDVETLPAELRAGAARGVLHVTRRWVRERHADADPTRAARIAGDLLAEHRTQ